MDLTLRNRDIEFFEKTLACIFCGGDLQLAGEQFTCKACSNVFVWEDGVLNMATQNYDVAVGKNQEFWDDRAKNLGSHERTTTCCSWGRALEQSEIQKFFDELPPQARVLEVGCGIGELLSLALKSGARTGAGIDLSPEMLKVAQHRRKPEEKLFYLRANMAKLPFRAELFDAVLSNRALQNLPEFALQEAAVSEIARVLKPGGQVLFIEGYRDGHDRLNIWRQRLGVPWAPAAWFNRYLTLAEWQKLRRFFAAAPRQTLYVFSTIAFDLLIPLLVKIKQTLKGQKPVAAPAAATPSGASASPSSAPAANAPSAGKLQKLSRLTAALDRKLPFMEKSVGSFVLLRWKKG